MGFAAGDSNLYRYVNNAQMGDTDPSGLDWQELAYTVYSRGKYGLPENKTRLTATIRVSLQYEKEKADDNVISVRAVYSVTNSKNYQVIPNATRFKLYIWFDSIPGAAEKETDVPIELKKKGSPGLSMMEAQGIVPLGSIDCRKDNSYWGRINVHYKDNGGLAAVQYVDWRITIKDKVPRKNGSWITLEETGRGREAELGGGNITAAQMLRPTETSGISGQMPLKPGKFNRPELQKPFPDQPPD
jgi:hypothetical protein